MNVRRQASMSSASLSASSAPNSTSIPADTIVAGGFPSSAPLSTSGAASDIPSRTSCVASSADVGKCAGSRRYASSVAPHSPASAMSGSSSIAFSSSGSIGPIAFAITDASACQSRAPSSFAARRSRS